MAQPPLSRAIQQLERRLGVRLLARTSRRVELTAASETLLHDGRKALTALEAATRLTQRAVSPNLVLVLKPGGDANLLEKILAACEAESLPVDIRFCAIGEQESLLRAGEADVALLHLPYDEPADLATEILLVDREIVLLPATHRLAICPSLTLAILPESFADHVPPNLAAVPLSDGDTSSIVLAWPEDSRSRTLARFVLLAASVTGRVAT